MEYRWNIDGLSKDYRRIIEELSKNYRRNAIYKHKITCFALDEWTGTDYQTIPAKKSKFTKIIVRLLRIKTKKQSCVLSIYWTSYMCYTLSLLHDTFQRFTIRLLIKSQLRIFSRTGFFKKFTFADHKSTKNISKWSDSFQNELPFKRASFQKSFFSNRVSFQTELSIKTSYFWAFSFQKKNLLLHCKNCDNHASSMSVAEMFWLLFSLFSAYQCVFSLCLLIFLVLFI